MNFFTFYNYVTPFLMSSLDEVNDFLNDVDEVATHADNISTGISGFFEGIAATFLALGTIGSVIVAAVVSIVGFLIALFEYLIPAICLFKLARKAGYKNAWFAFIPVLQTYLEFVLPRKQFNFMGIFKTGKREAMGITYLLLYFFCGTIIAVLQSIPIVGQTLGICFVIVLNIFVFIKVYDLFITFSNKEKAIIIALINVLIPGNLVYSIGLLTIMNKEPDYGRGNFYNINTGSDIHNNVQNQYAYYQQPYPGQPMPPQGYAPYPAQPMPPQGYPMPPQGYPQGQPMPGQAIPPHGYPQQGMPQPPVQPRPMQPQAPMYQQPIQGQPPVAPQQPVQPVAPQQPVAPAPAPQPTVAPQPTPAPAPQQPAQPVAPQTPPQNPQQ